MTTRLVEDDLLQRYHDGETDDGEAADVRKYLQLFLQDTLKAWAEQEGERVASQRSDVFHLPGCAAVARIKPENLTRFPSRAAALQSGRHPAVDCRP